MADIPDTSRRTVLAGLMTGGLVAATSTASAQSSSTQAAISPPRSLEDPASKYPKPPFPRQSQEWPGLASKMDPRPDHGEKSYKGSGRLSGRKALITGGDSGIGRAAAIAFAREGADVAFGYLPQEESDAKEVVELIRAEGRKALPLPGDIREEAFCRKLVADAVSGLGGLDILVNTRRGSIPSIPSRISRHSSWTTLSRRMSMRCSGSRRQPWTISLQAARSSTRLPSTPMIRARTFSIIPAPRPRS